MAGIYRLANGRLRAEAYDPRTRKRTARTFDSASAAKAWKRDAEASFAKGTLQAGKSPTLQQVAKDWMAGATTGTILSRSGAAYRPSTLKRYALGLDNELLPALGHLRLSEIRPGKIQTLIEGLTARGLSASSVRNTLIPLQSIYRWALRRELVTVDPTAAIELPRDRARRDRFASPEEVSLLLATVDTRDQALWATAIYAGLRLGELAALRWSNVDLIDGINGIIHVVENYNAATGTLGEPKTQAGARRVPIAGVLAEYLGAHRDRAEDLTGLVFARSALAGTYRGADRHFCPNSVVGRAQRRWQAQGVAPIGLHECRHTCASLMIAAGLDAKSVQTYLGHSSITVTFDRYGHLFPGNEAQAAGKLDSFLDAAKVAA